MESVCEPMEPDEDSFQRNAEGAPLNKEDFSTDQKETLCNLDNHLKKGNEVETPEAREAMCSDDATLDGARDFGVNLASTSLDKANVLFAFSHHKVQDKGMQAIISEGEEQEVKSSESPVDEKVVKIEEKQLESISETQNYENLNSLEQENWSAPPSVNPEIKAEIHLGGTVIGESESFVYESIICEDNLVREESFTRPDSVTCENPGNVSKMDVSSEDEEVHLYTNSGKSGAESSSSKDESPSGPSCSGTSHVGINSLSSDSEDDLPSLNFTLPVKKRKRDTPVSSDDECKSEIDYANLTPEEIKALIDEAKRYGTIKRCLCPKKKWEELPIKGPTETSKKCTIGKGDWSEKLPCEACSSGVCAEVNHKHGRRTRRRALINPRMSVLSRTRARGTIGQDVPVIDLSDSEEVSSLPANVASEVTITAVPGKPPPPPEECIVLSSSEDDDDIVCEGVVVCSEKRKQATGAEASGTASIPKEVSSPDVVELPPQTLPLPSAFGMPPVLLPTPPPQDSELWPDLDIDLANWNDTINLLANIAGPPNADGAGGMQVNASGALPDRPSTPEGWSCPICLESKTAVIEIMSTTCGHVFCGNCIRSAVKIHKKCPTCRKKLTLKQFHRIFL